MAYKDSEELKSDERYPLGDYSFRIERSSVPGSSNDKIEAICTDKDGHNARKSIQLPSSTQLSGWYVEANGTEATVYATVKVPSGGGGGTVPGDNPFNIPSFAYVQSNTVTVTKHIASTGKDETTVWTVNSASPVFLVSGISDQQSVPGWTYVKSIFASKSRFSFSTQFTYDGKTVYGWPVGGNTIDPADSIEVSPNTNGSISNSWNFSQVAWLMLYDGESSEYETDEVMVGRFAIDLGDAGGVGPGSDWTDPGDYDPDWEPEDPTHTLYVEVTGALSGRHNDPIVDPSYSYIPADKDTVKDYGCGGDGGHGGGGGAGASTVVVHKFATNQANSKEVTAIARRHGYGSGGGKGGKGGDGCILVYY